MQVVLAVFAGDGEDRTYDGMGERRRIGKAYWVNDGVRALRVFDGFGDRSVFLLGDPVRQQNESLAAHQAMHGVFGSSLHGTENEGGIALRDLQPVER
jgi:hypothetical protein